VAAPLGSTGRPRRFPLSSNRAAVEFVLGVGDLLAGDYREGLDTLKGAAAAAFQDEAAVDSMLARLEAAGLDLDDDGGGLAQRAQAAFSAAREGYSGTCSSCGEPTRRSWRHCPTCGGTTFLERID